MNASTLKDLETIGRSARRAVGQFLREVRGYRLDTLITADPAFAPSEATTRDQFDFARQWLPGAVRRHRHRDPLPLRDGTPVRPVAGRRDWRK